MTGPLMWLFNDPANRSWVSTTAGRGGREPLAGNGYAWGQAAHVLAWVYAVLGAGEPVEVDQSALTGESLPVTKYEGEVVFQGSAVKRGELQAIVTATGASSFSTIRHCEKMLWTSAD